MSGALAQNAGGQNAGGRQSEPARFALQLAVAAPVEELQAWLNSAAPGAEAIYASGFDLPRAAPGVVLAREWAAQGRVILVSRRDPEDGRRWQFLIVKPRALSAEVAEQESAAPQRAVNRTALGEMLRLLRKYAERGRACPSNSELARALGLRTRHQARHLIGRLISEDKISVKDCGRKVPRVVTILSSGKQTGCERKSS